MEDSSVPPETLAALCQAYGLTQNGVARRVSERVWRVPTSAGDVAAKRYRAGQHERAAKEAALLEHLNAHADARFRVQSLMRTQCGDAVWTQGDGTAAMLTRWEAGQSRTYDTFTPEEWAALGASLAALHASLDTLDRLPAQDTLSSRLQALEAEALRQELDSAPALAPPGTDVARLRRYTEICLRLLDAHHAGSLAAFPMDDPQRPIHNDYNQFNYLFGDALPPLVLDWEASMGAPREYELVRCLNHLPLEAAQLARTFVHAYLRVRPLRPERMAWAVDAACLQHAAKRWMLQGWLADPRRFDTPLQGALRMVSMMDGARGQLIDFYGRCLEAPH
ncbi:Phosphotransferase enzyme family [Bordetella ansorpii]|uniref:Phosphotransferase enzyme family n=1 Tax=Bordetella ansorpii TaxID=288768 RepID=A0A157STM0_9BORD|nr:phosphotransferase [Bordetella ansorpii]SAI73820.1 Phosphotransferase enzyme family [Bordetella ansorpii]